MIVKKTHLGTYEWAYYHYRDKLYYYGVDIGFKVVKLR